MFQIYADGELLYSPDLADEGYGVINPKLTIELNKSGSLEFTLPPNNVMYDKISKLKTQVTVNEDGKTIWWGRVLHDKKDFYKRKSIYCEGILAWLVDSILRPYDFKGTVTNYIRYMVTCHNEQVDSSKKIRLGNVTVSDSNDYVHYSSTQYPTTLSEITEKLVNKYGGYLSLYHNSAIGWYQLDYTSTSGDISDQVIQFGENLLDITEYIDAKDVFTVLIPLGAKQKSKDGKDETEKRLTIESVNNGLDYIENTTASSIFGKIWKTNTWDNVTEASNLLTKGEVFLNSGIEMSVTLSIKAIDLHLIDVKTERIQLGQYVRVISEPHNLDTHFLCSKIILDMQNPDKSEYTFGTAFTAMTEEQIKIKKQSANAYGIATDASTTANSVSVNVEGNFLSKADFLVYQEQVNAKLSAVFHYKGTIPTVSDLPKSGVSVGDTYNVDFDGANYAWTGSEWDKLSETIDLSGYALKTDVPSKVSEFENDAGYLTKHQSLEDYALKTDIPTDYVNMTTFEELVARVQILEANN